MSLSSSSWSSLSDRNKKDNIIKLNYINILEKLDKIDIYDYNYKSQDKSVRTMGPMAQEWYEQFKTNKNQLMIEIIDLNGVSLVSIKGLYEINKEQEKINKNLYELI